MINHIELAKECGAVIFPKGCHIQPTILKHTGVHLTPEELASYTNAVIEICAKVAETQSGYKPEYRIRALKVKG